MLVDDIWKATKRGDLGKVRELIERDGIPLDGNDLGSVSLLTVACGAGHAHIVRYLMEHKYDVLDRDWYAPYAFAALENNHIEVLKVLLEFGIEADSIDDKNGDSLIRTAIDNKQRDAVRLFLEHGVNLEEVSWIPDSEFRSDTYYLNEKGEDDDPSLIEIAARTGRPDMVEFFLAVGANLNGQSVESYLKRAKENEVLRLEFEEAERLKEEIRRQQQAEREVVNRKNQLFRDTKEGRLAILKALHEGIDANHTDRDGNNMLFNFLQQKRPFDKADLAYLPQLLNLTDLSHTNKSGESAWEMAERQGQIRAMFYLMEQAGISISPKKRFLLNCRFVLSWISDALFGVLLVTAIVLFGCFMLCAFPFILLMEKLKPNNNLAK